MDSAVYATGYYDHHDVGGTTKGETVSPERAKTELTRACAGQSADTQGFSLAFTFKRQSTVNDQATRTPGASFHIFFPDLFVLRNVKS